MSEYYCPECLSKLEKYYGCGNTSYFCPACRKLVSTKKMLDPEAWARARAEEPTAEETQNAD